MNTTERVAHIVALARGGQSFAAIADEMGLTRERIRQLAAAGGITKRDVPVPCHFCGSPLYRARRGVQGGIHACGGCQLKREAYLRSLVATPRAVCAGCGATLTKPARAAPSFCVATTACLAAKQRHRYATVAAYREYVRQYQPHTSAAAAKRGRER